jgi:hypothetical protein
MIDLLHRPGAPVTVRAVVPFAVLVSGLVLVSCGKGTSSDRDARADALAPDVHEESFVEVPSADDAADVDPAPEPAPDVVVELASEADAEPLPEATDVADDAPAEVAPPTDTAEPGDTPVEAEPPADVSADPEPAPDAVEIAEADALEATGGQDVDVPPPDAAEPADVAPEAEAVADAGTDSGVDVAVTGDPSDTLFDPSHVVAVDLELPPSSIDALWIEPREYVPATVTLTVRDEPPVTLAVGVHLKGKIGSFRDLNGKAGFKIKINYHDKSLRYRGLKGLTLNNMVQDRAMLHEPLAMRIFRAFDVPAPRMGLAWVRVNGADYGLYHDVETYDDVFLDRHFATTAHLYQGEYGNDVTSAGYTALTVEEGDEDDLLDLQMLVAAANDSPDEAWMEAMTPLVDLPELWREWAVEQTIGHWDGYSTQIVNNYWLHSDDDGVFSLLPWDCDQTFEQYRDVHTGNGYLFVRCMGVPECRRGYDRALADLVALLATLDNDAFVVNLAAFEWPFVQADPRREYSADAVAWNVQATRDFLVTRQAAMADLVACLTDPAADKDGDGRICDRDCDEGDPSTYVGAAETCGDGRDNDCSGHVDDALDCDDCTPAFRGPHRYLLCPVPRPWADARAHCQAAGADLVVVGDAAEDAWVRAQALAHGFWADAWLGLADLDVEGTFAWVDGSPVSFWGFAPGEPNDWGGNEDCTEMYLGGWWNDLDCNGLLGVVCEDPCPAGQDTDGDGHPRCGDDCDDADPSVHPGASEMCGNGRDDDCDGTTDAGPTCLPVQPLDVQPPVAGATLVVTVDALDRDQARAVCRALGPGADLAWLTSNAEATAAHLALAASVPGVDVWLGLNDQATEGLYTWPTGAVPLFTKWAPGQPDNGGGGPQEDCVRWRSDATWDDTDCAPPLQALCRVPL